MRPLGKLLMTVFLVVVLSGCLSFKPPQRTSKFEPVRCVSRAEDINSHYGAPDTTGLQAGYVVLTWYYGVWKPEYRNLQRKLVVFVNKKGLVVDYVFDAYEDVKVVDRCSP
jgi:hypothetical protein